MWFCSGANLTLGKCNVSDLLVPTYFKEFCIPSIWKTDVHVFSFNICSKGMGVNTHSGSDAPVADLRACVLHESRGAPSRGSAFRCDSLSKPPAPTGPRWSLPPWRMRTPRCLRCAGRARHRSAFERCCKQRRRQGRGTCSTATASTCQPRLPNASAERWPLQRRTIFGSPGSSKSKPCSTHVIDYLDFTHSLCVRVCLCVCLSAGSLCALCAAAGGCSRRAAGHRRHRLGQRALHDRPPGP